MAEPASLSRAASVSGPEVVPAPSRHRIQTKKSESDSNRKRPSNNISKQSEEDNISILSPPPNKRTRRLPGINRATATATSGQSEHRGRGKGRPPASDTSLVNRCNTDTETNTNANGKLNSTELQLRSSRSSCSSRSNSLNSTTTEENYLISKSPYSTRRNENKAFKKNLTPRNSPSRDTGTVKKNINIAKTNSLSSLTKSKNKSSSLLETATSNWDNLADKQRRDSKSSKARKREDSSSTSLKQNLTYPTDNSGTHKYTLRSQVKLSSSEPTGLVSRLSQLGRRAVSTKKKTKANIEIKTSPKTVDEEPGPSSSSTSTSRLTRSTGVVLRRSTRNSKGPASTTGSCASSGGSGAAGSSSRRTGGGNKISVMSTTQPQQPHQDGNSIPTTTNTSVATSNIQDTLEPPSPQEGTQASASSGVPSGPGPDSESDDSEVGRLQALLEARGLPPHLFGALGPRMQHLLHRSMGAGSSSKAQQLLQGLQATGDEGQQLQSVIEMCQMLVMGNEDTLTGFPVKQVVPALINLLNMEHNFDMMNHACRALTYMMEALPRSSAVVVDAVPIFLEKLQVIQCMDVAEQSLTALDMLSRRHSKAILQARGVSACLMFLDFFSINAQRAALSVTANCCQNLSVEEFALVSDSIPLLANRLVQQDRRSVESVCLAFSRLTDSMQNDPVRLLEIATTELLTNLQQLLVVTPPVISTGTFITVLRMLSVMCANCPDLALTLLRQNIAETLLYLLTGSAAGNNASTGEVELIPRSPQELYEITCLIGELMPRLPTDGIFTVDSLLERSNQAVQDSVTWQWRDDRGVWHQYSSVDSRIIEAAHLGGEDEVSLTTLGRTYTIDFHAMQQINEDTGTSRPVQRRFTPSTQNTPSPCAQTQPQDIEGAQTLASRTSSENGDARVNCLREESGLAASFIRSLFSVLYEVYSSSAGPAVRCKCLRALLRMVYYANADLLRDVLKNQVVSSHIAGMMASNDLRIVVGALQMAEILMNKLPDEFGVHFRREGVMHQITQLADPQVPLGVSPPKVNNNASNISSSTTINDSKQPQPSTSSGNITLNSTPMSHRTSCTSNGTGGPSRASTTSTALIFTSTPSDNHVDMTEVRASSPSQARLSDVLKRKRPPKRSSNGSRSKSRQDDLNLSSSLMQDLFSKATSLGSSTGRSTPTGSTTNRSRFTGASAKTSSFLASLNPARWGRSVNNSSLERGYSKDSTNTSCLSKSLSQHNLTAGHKEKARTWVREQASKFLETYSGDENSGPPHPACNILQRLKSAIEKLSTPYSLLALQELRDILIESDISPFEVNHSGLIKALLAYLAEPEGHILNRDDRLRTFMHVFAGIPLEQYPTGYYKVNSAWMAALVNKLSGCVSQLEQFPVRVHDLPAGSGRGSTSALKFFNTHQLKCNLQRHPDCNNLKQWKGGTVKIDPLALVQAIERYLVVRGYGRVRDKDSGDSDEDNSDEDIDDTLAAVVISQGGSKHKLQFLIGNHILPYNMTVYQAVKQYSLFGNDQSETDTDTETPLGNAGVWVQTHTIYYRPLVEEPSGSKSSLGYSSSGRKGKGTSSKTNHRRKGDELWNDGIVPQTVSPLRPFLNVRLPDSVTIQDASLEVLCLLRILNALNRHWASLYIGVEQRHILPQSEFINSKLAAKASRQLQDPLVIMTGNLPSWLSQIAAICPFLFPFETRQLLFYATSFDRDRALQRLLDSTPELSAADSSERVTPRLDRRKRTISRDDILRQAEQVIQDLAGSKALLEVQYENEVGTGLGPTLEFYALVSRELQRNDLELWKHHGDDANGETSVYVQCPTGLFPVPLGRPTKVSHISKVKAKFRFLGKFMAKAVMDSRMLDLPFSVAFHRWLLGQESCLSLEDLQSVAPEVHRTLSRLQPLVYQRDMIIADESLPLAQRNEQCERLGLDGCTVSDLGLDFVLPGHGNVELRRGGRETAVTIHNLDEYLRLVSHWFLFEGVSRQMDALREGFESVFPLRQLRMFYPEEMEAVFCGSSQSSENKWDVRTLIECCRPDHGYTSDSRAIRFLFEVLSSYNREEQRLFVQFVTGSPRLPVGGFRALSPPLTVVRKTLEPNMNPDDYLPSVMTCVNYLKLPEYSSVKVMRDKLRIAASEGQHSFHLS